MDSVVPTEDLSASVLRWWRQDDGTWAVEEVIGIPAEPAAEEGLPPALRPFGVVPALVTDISLSVDDRRLYVSCWGTGELKPYDVSDPAHPRETGSVRVGGVAGGVPHPSAPEKPLAGGPQMVETSRDGTRVYVTSSRYGARDDRFCPRGIGAWMARIDADTEHGRLLLDEDFSLDEENFRGLRVHQIRPQGGDASSDSSCFRT